MSLTQSDIKIFKSTNISDSSANGGAMSNLELADAVGALFPNVDNTERTNGSTKWRKIFFKVNSETNETLYSTKVYQDYDTPGSDTLLMTPATSFSDTQFDIPTTPTLYGSLPLYLPVSTNENSLQVELPVDIPNFYKVGQLIRITDKATVASSGSEEFITITDVEVTSRIVTLTVSPSLSYNYSADISRVASVFEAGDISASISNVSVASTLGTVDLTEAILVNKSAITETWNLTFTSPIMVSVTSGSSGSFGTVNITSGVSILNTALGLPYFTLPVQFFTGNYTTGDTISFTTNAAAIPMWIKRIVPAGALPIASNKATYVLDGGTV